MTEESNRLKEEELLQRKKDEYDRWFARGKEATRDQFKSTCVAMRHDSNAFMGFADGYDSKAKKAKKK
jgi:hypothetical protein